MTSEFDREELVRLKKRAEYERSDEFEGEPTPDLDPENITILNKNNLFERVNESMHIVTESLNFYNNVLLPDIYNDISNKLPRTHVLKIDCGSTTTQEIIDVIKTAIGEPTRILRPLPRKIEGVDDFPSLLTAPATFENENEGEETEGKPNRRWS